MLSVTQVKEKLPEKFVSNLYELYTPLTVDKILKGFCVNRSTTLRANTLKTTINEVMNNLKENNIKFNRVNWNENALELKDANEKDIQKIDIYENIQNEKVFVLTKVDIYENGEIYMQSLPSMIPAIVLSPKTNENVLDLTAAPRRKNYSNGSSHEESRIHFSE